MRWADFHPMLVTLGLPCLHQLGTARPVDRLRQLERVGHLRVDCRNNTNERSESSALSNQIPVLLELDSIL